MDVKPLLKDRHRIGGRGRGRDERRKLGEDGVPVCFGPVGGRDGGMELGRAEGDQNGDMVYIKLGGKAE